MYLKPIKNILKLILSIVLTLGALPTLAQNCIPWSDRYFQKTNLIIGKIEVNTGDIFDLTNPKESKLIHQVSNKLHINTQPKVVRRQLLFKEGDTLNRRLLEESERLIRANRFIKDVAITPSQLCDTSDNPSVNITVNTNDRWTLAPGISFGKSGGKNKTGIEIQENNLFGLGKSISLSYKDDSERQETNLRYSDHQFLGSRKHLLASIINNSDGDGYQLNLSLPYYSLNSRRAWGTKNSSIKKENSIYTKGEVSEKVKVDEKVHSAFWGWSKGLQNNSVNRFKVGWNFTETQYKQLQPITQSYPWFEYEYLHEQYTTRTNFRSMGEVEDVPLGLDFTVEVGLLNSELGSSENHVRLATKVSKGYEFGKGLAFVHSDLTTYLGEGKLEGETLKLKGELYTFDNDGSDFYFSGTLRTKTNLQEGEQLLLGGETGLRGFPEGYQNGTKSLVLTAEKRFHFDWYPLQLAKFGAVIFADVGTTRGGNGKAEVLADVGFGLRMIPTRTSNIKAIHLDFAFPIDADKNVDGFQINIKTQKSF